MCFFHHHRLNFSFSAEYRVTYLLGFQNNFNRIGLNMMQVILNFFIILLFCYLNFKVMESRNLYKSYVLFITVIVLLFLASCGPIVVSSRIGQPPPPWFYPNRLEVVRYVYFPEYSFYYDLSARTYVYLDGGVWVRRNVLPSRYQNIDLRRSKYERIRNYSDENIRRYHEDNNANRGRSNRTTPRSNTRRN
tara:strand:- start:527 stop:1099 length:573 start_codon:yes stop_codon:yes gene_type:complete